MNWLKCNTDGWCMSRKSSEEFLWLLYMQGRVILSMHHNNNVYKWGLGMVECSQTLPLLLWGSEAV
uniref:Putative ovule protein n=1 Tax=Solanum chacoense TaxID=4108 RepID=A0A0V0GHC2_SOLCH